MLTQARLKELLHYDPETGVFTWRARNNGKMKAGATAGTLQRGYRWIKINYRDYAAHRLAWLYSTGAWPKHYIDHINRVRDDNRLANLREATKAQNGHNVSLSKNNRTGYTGVRFIDGKYRAGIKAYGISYYLGRHDTAEQAHHAYLEAKRRLHSFVEDTVTRECDAPPVVLTRQPSSIGRSSKEQGLSSSAKSLISKENLVGATEFESATPHHVKGIRVMENTIPGNDLRETVTKECDAILHGLKRPLHEYCGAWVYKHDTTSLWSVNLDIANTMIDWDRVRTFQNVRIAQAVVDEMRELIRAARRLRGLP